jgi:transposase-like protein
MATYSKEFKNKIISRMLPPNNESVSQLSKETQIHEQTLRNWRSQARKSGIAVPGNNQVAERWSSEDKFLIVLETSSMNEIELAEYCRKKGLYPEEVKSWKHVCMKANGGVAEEASRLNKELKVKSKEVKNLEKELQRKEKALAETAALLVLRKKMNAIWGTEDEDE